MLKGTLRVAEPSVIRHVHHETRTTPHELPKQLGKDALVADHDAERGWRTLKHRSASTGLELGDELGPTFHEPNDSRQRHELSERNEVDLIIPADDALFGEQERGVTLPRGIDDVHRADQERHTGLPTQIAQRLEQIGVLPKEGR